MSATLRPLFAFLCSASCLGLGGLFPSSANAEDISETLRIRGRLHSGWELSGKENPGTWSDSFYLHRARIDGRWKPNDWSKLNLEFEFSNNNFRIRDAYAEFSPFKQSDLDLDFTVGHFKKPFSRLRMMSPWDLDIPERGLMNAFVANGTRFGGFGARDIGLMVSGNVKGPALFTEAPLNGAFAKVTTMQRYQTAHDLIRPYVTGENGETSESTLLSSPEAFDPALQTLFDHLESRHEAAEAYLKSES